MSSSSSGKGRAGRRVAVCYCATFLKPEMQHIYRQLGAVKGFQVKVLTRKREQAELFPFPAVTVVARDPWRWLRRIVYRQILQRPIPVAAAESAALMQNLSECGGAVLHIIFGNTAVQLLPLIAAAERTVPVIVSFHGADVLGEMDKPGHRKAALEVLGRVDLVLARSHSLVEALRNVGCPPEKIRLNRTGIPLQAFSYQERAEPAAGCWRLFQASRLIAKKGVMTTLHAFASFRDTYPNATLAIAGEGPQEAELRALAGALGLGAAVEFTGFLAPERLQSQLYRAHFFLHPSEMGADGDQEGVPNALLEAMATGLPAFATRHGGIPEAIESGVNGWLVEEGDHAGLAEALLTFAAAPARLTALGAAGSRSVAENFELKTQAAKLESYYREAIEEAWISDPDR